MYTLSRPSPRFMCDSYSCSRGKPTPFPHYSSFPSGKLRHYEGKYVILRPCAEILWWYSFRMRQYASFESFWGMDIRPIEESFAEKGWVFLWNNCTILFLIFLTGSQNDEFALIMTQFFIRKWPILEEQVGGFSPGTTVVKTKCSLMLDHQG